MLYILLCLLVLEWILISQPIVEIGSAWLNMTEQFTIYEMQGSSTLTMIIALLHIVSIAAILAPLVMKRHSGGIYYIPFRFLGAPQRILCKRFSTTSRISRFQCA